MGAIFKPGMLILWVGMFSTVIWAGDLAEMGNKADPKGPTQLRQFDFTIGQWEVTCRYMQPDRSYKTGKAMYQAVYILDGRVVQDFWKQVDPTSADGKLVYGTAVRSYDEKTGKWRFHWFDDQGNISKQIEGSFADGKGVFKSEGADQFGAFTSTITFYDIEKDRFMWRQDHLYEGGVSVEGVLIQEFRRVK